MTDSRIWSVTRTGARTSGSKPGGKKVETLLGPKYPVVTIWLPNGPGGQPREFICFEPLTTIINGVNLAHEGKWSGLQTLPPGEKWTESFWVRASGI